MARPIPEGYRTAERIKQRAQAFKASAAPEKK